MIKKIRICKNNEIVPEAQPNQVYKNWLKKDEDAQYQMERDARARTQMYDALLTFVSISAIICAFIYLLAKAISFLSNIPIPVQEAVRVYTKEEKMIKLKEIIINETKGINGTYSFSRSENSRLFFEVGYEPNCVRLVGYKPGMNSSSAQIIMNKRFSTEVECTLD